MPTQDPTDKTIQSLQRTLLALAGLLVLAVVATVILIAFQLGWITPSAKTVEQTTTTNDVSSVKPTKTAKPLWQAPSESVLAKTSNGELIRYGKELIANTSLYLGPKGKVAHIANGMNCQNCHLDSGTKPWGNNYSAVASTYPKFRARSGMTESIVKRVNDCFERSLNGKALDSTSREMKAIVAYIHFLGDGVPKGENPNGSGIWKVPYLDRAASPDKGKLAYKQKCVSCHGNTGQGIANPDGNGFTFPPLWGSHSYNQGAGLFRLSRLAGYIKANMPLGASWDKPQLSDEDAWDIAAYINSMPRPAKDLRNDWPKLASKPVDHPFGPYTDSFSEKQHKFGPFKPIEAYKKEHPASK
ncbi:c-type cytochrome [Spirosoma sp.]|uniref:c-type cytochrome n=1 Tax=Spirosoma sp. TaxID=1899569 RepID=UPI002636EA96|nr:c-type cytochrome [Spirosoma sp.]MCX6216788.1 c-type cytochrome [Spirosoma sp.]